jgi:hypothetical protein
VAGIFKGIDSKGRPLVAGGEQPRDPGLHGAHGGIRMGYPSPDGNRADRRAYDKAARRGGRTELQPETPAWDGVHETEVPGTKADPTAQARCSCGWESPDVHTGKDRRWQAMADADQHHNEN